MGLYRFRVGFFLLSNKLYWLLYFLLFYFLLNFFLSFIFKFKFIKISLYKRHNFTCNCVQKPLALSNQKPGPVHSTRHLMGPRQRLLQAVARKVAPLIIDWATIDSFFYCGLLSRSTFSLLSAVNKART